ncbi:peptidoglycan editing factor PgeF [Paraliobacillus sp. JSM ZJ581]|uniref:peptidoglycan editing factor PgeF n=1 Tax=Paraliobacillus sp. JSM ZJ581 TaxID=3342118 RepID=UPI0035A831C8
MEPFIQIHSSIVGLNAWHEVDPNLVVGFTTRHGGVSKSPYDSFNLGLHVNDNQQDVLANRNVLSQLLAYPLNNWVMAEQTHGTKIHLVTSADRGSGALDVATAIPNTDGLITKEKNILLVAMFADCVPLYFWDTSTGWIGIAHAGWKGTVKQMAVNMIKKLKAHGANIDTLYVGIGPSISQTNYEINNHVFNHIPIRFREQVTKKVSDMNYLLNLSSLNYYMLIEHGIQPENIYQSHLCTYSDPLFFSYRYEKGQTGRMLGYIGKRCN